MENRSVKVKQETKRKLDQLKLDREFNSMDSLILFLIKNYVGQGAKK